VVTDNYTGAFQLAEHLLEEMSSVSGSARSDLYFLGGNARLPASARRIDGFKDALKKRDLIVDESHIIACGYDRNRAGSELQRLHAELGQLPAGLLVNSIDCFEGVLEFLSRLPEVELRQCTIGCFDYDPFCALLRFPVHMVRQRTQSLIRLAYECIESGSQDPCLILVKPEMIACE
jgi:LacI family fructose operon transcriptional repressor